MFKKKKNLHLFPVFSSQKVGIFVIFRQFCRNKNCKVMDRKTEKHFSALLLGEKACKGEIPYALDNLFYENFGMSCEEVLKNCCRSIDILS